MRRGLCVLMLAFTFITVQVRADDIYLKGGSHIVGTITGIADDGKLLIKTEFAGEIAIPQDAIQGIQTEDEKGIKLESDVVLSGRLVFRDGKQHLVTGDAEIEVSPNGIAAFGDPAKLSDPSNNVNWSGRAEFGLILEMGNTERLDVDAKVQTTREREMDRLKLSLRAEYTEENDSKTTNEALGEATYEYDIGERLFVFGQTQLEFDEFEDLDLRTVASGGVGLFLIDTERQTLKIRFGLGYQYQRFNDAVVTHDGLVQLSYDYKLDVRGWFQFISEMDFFANATDTRDWRFEAENAIEVPISSAEKWKLRLGLRNEYDNEPQPGVDSLDTTVFSALVYDWK